MADLSRIKGFSFNGVEVNNYLTNDIFVLDVIESAIPNLLYSEFNFPNRDGGYSVQNKYENKEVSILLGIYAKTVEERRVKERNLLSNFIGVEGKLLLFDKPNLFYNAKLYNEVPRTEKNVFTELKLTFLCSFSMHELYDDLRDYTVNQLDMEINNLDGILINKASWKNITGSTVKTITNSGNYKALPIFEITGTADLLTIQVNDSSFNIANINGTVYVNCEKMICYTLTGSVKTSFLQKFTGVFPVVSVGENNVAIGGNNLNLTEITIEFPNTYIV